MPLPPPSRPEPKRRKVATKASANKQGGRKKNACGLCGKPGHSRRTCGSEVKPTSAQSESPLPEGYERDIADAIRDEWAEAGRPSHEVCKDLAISLAEFNRIVEKYKIVRT